MSQTDMTHWHSGNPQRSSWGVRPHQQQPHIPPSGQSMKYGGSKLDGDQDRIRWRSRVTRMSWKSQGLPYWVREPMWVHVGLWVMTGQTTGDIAGSVGKRRGKCRKTLTAWSLMITTASVCHIHLAPPGLRVYYCLNGLISVLPSHWQKIKLYINNPTPLYSKKSMADQLLVSYWESLGHNTGEFATFRDDLNPMKV